MHGDFPFWFILMLTPEFWFVLLPLCVIAGGAALYSYLKRDKSDGEES